MALARGLVSKEEFFHLIDEKRGDEHPDYWDDDSGFSEIIDQEGTIPERIISSLHSVDEDFLARLRRKKYDIREIRYTRPTNVEPHTDNCEFTIIVYLYKHPSIIDRFYIEGEHVDGLWSEDEETCGVLVFNGYKEHWVEMEGEESREILVLHSM